jgi:lysophospholipase L1-like esterase
MMRSRRSFCQWFVAPFLGSAALRGQERPIFFQVVDDWSVKVVVPDAGVSGVVHVNPPVMVRVISEEYKAIPVFNPKTGGWLRGVQLRGVKAQETTSPRLLDPDSFQLRSMATSEAPALRRGVDFEIDTEWGTFGRLPDGSITPEQSVFASYRHAELRVDAVVLTADKQLRVRQGQPRAAAPPFPQAAAGERHLGNIYLSGFIPKLGPDHLFPVLEQSHPKQAASAKSAAIERIKSRLGKPEPLRILAWGDSVTDGAYLPDKSQRWQEQFVSRLRQLFPASKIELMTQAWGGRNTGSYLAEPPGSPHNYKETVLALKPDVIISEFVNDARLSPEQVEERYSGLLRDFKEIGAEWIILTPHYVRPDWMDLTRERDIDEDPRPYVRGLREFAAKHNVALADASRRYGRLWRQGIPYNTLMVNAINHPDARGMKLFADALIALFQ